MRIEIRTDRRLESRRDLSEEVEVVVEKALSGFGDRITSVEVRLSGEEDPPSGRGDKRCLLETRTERFEPILTSHLASNVPEAVDGACGKTRRSLEKKVETLRRR